jgi:clan AA aspartic protease
MGLVYADIQLTNVEDIFLAKRKQISKDSIKNITVNMLVDSGAYMMAVNEEVKMQLGLDVIETTAAQLADGSMITLDIVGPIEVNFKNRRCTVDAMLLKGDTECLLGAIPMEAMDILIHPLQQELIVNPKHPMMKQLSLK